MDSQLLEVVIALIAIFGGLLPMILSSHYPFKKSPFQVLITKNDDNYTITIRNISSNFAFIDGIKLHKYPNNKQFGIRNISNKFKITINTKILPGEIISALYTSDEIKQIVLENYKDCYGKEYDGYGKCRISYKITIESSEGNVGTKWFKMGYKNETWRFYDFMWKRGSYYPTGKCYERRILEKYFVYFVMFATLIVAVAAEYGSIQWLGISLSLPLICLMVGCLGATDGYRTALRCMIDSLLYSVPLIIWAYYMTSSVELTISQIEQLYIF